MFVKLINHTPRPEETVAVSARLCYSSLNVKDIVKKFKSRQEISGFINKLKKLGHWSPFEHISFTFGIEGISRACSHQLVRHRIASYSQQSQRYVLEKRKIFYVTPPSISKNKEANIKYQKFMALSGELYDFFIKQNIPKEDARFALPNAAFTNIIVTMNARVLTQFFSARLCSRAQWEIRAVAKEMLKHVKKCAPLIFKGVGAACETLGYCPEGEMSCKKQKKKNKKGRK